MVAQNSVVKPESYNFLEEIAEMFFLNTRGWYFTKMGHPGQKQYGTDIYGSLLDDGSYIIIQCKCHNDGDLTINEIQNEISRVKELKIKVSQMYFVTSAQADSNVQKFTMEYDFGFPVRVIYWDTIEKWLLMNPEIKSLLYMNSFSMDVQVIRRFLLACIKYHIYDVLEVYDCTSYVPAKLLDEADSFEIEMDDIISRSAQLSKDVFKDMNDFKVSYTYIMNNLACGHPDGNGYYIIVSYTAEQRDYIQQQRQKLWNIYIKYKQVVSYN